MLANQHNQDSDLERCRLFINKIKDHRHSKIKGKHIDKFKRLYFKCYGYHNNLNRHAENINNTNHQNTLSGHQNVPSSITTTSTPVSNQTTVPATPMPPHLPPAQWIPTQHPGSHPPASTIHVQTSGSPTYPKPPSLRNNYHYSKKDLTMPSPQIPP